MDLVNLYWVSGNVQKENGGRTMRKIFKRIIWFGFIVCFCLVGKSEASAEEWLWPLDGYTSISSYFGPRDTGIAGASKYHNGIDIPAPAGTPIRAAKTGYIVPRGYHSDRGNWSVIDHQDGTYSEYQHMSSFAITSNGWVNQGDIIGYVGNTGIGSGAHLHFEIRTGARDQAHAYDSLTAHNPLDYSFIYSLSGGSTNPDDYPFPTRNLYYTNPTFKGDDVKWVQAVLNYLGYSVAIDGSYGPDCADKVASFQRDNGLGQDGKCGPATREKLKAVYEAKKNPPPSHETNPPVVSNVKIYDVDSTGYTISCKVTDESGVGTVRFPTWTEKNGQDDLDMKWWDGDSKCIGTKNGDTWTFRVKDSKHNYERGAYTTHIYAYDMHGVHNEPVEVNGTISNTYKPSATVTWNNRQYELYDDILGWSEARKKCEDLGGTLAVITSKEEQDAVNKLLKNADRSWYSIGGVKAGNEFIWLTGEKMNYTYWGKGEPNNNGGDEYHMSVYKSGTWNDSSDWVSKGFILEKELPKKPAEPEDNQGDSSNQPQNPSNPSGGQSGNSGQGGTTSDPDKNGDGNQTPTPGTGNSDTNVTEGTGQQSNSDTTKPSNGSDMTNSSTDKNTGTSRNRTVKSTTKSVTVAWKPDKNAISGYRIYVKSGRKYVKVGTTKAGKTTFTIKKIKGKSLKPGTSYTVRIVSLKKISGKLKEVKRITLKTATKPSAPSIYYGKKKSSAKAVVKWGRVSGASGYEIQMSTRSKKGFKKIATVKASKASVTKTRLKRGKTYYFRVRAYKNVTGGKVYSSWSRVKKVR